VAPAPIRTVGTVQRWRARAAPRASPWATAERDVAPDVAEAKLRGIMRYIALVFTSDSSVYANASIPRRDPEVIPPKFPSSPRHAGVHVLDARDRPLQRVKLRVEVRRDLGQEHVELILCHRVHD